MGDSEKSLVIRRNRTAVAWCLLASLVLLSAQKAHAHPLHTSLAQITYDVKTGAVLLSLRVFVDDYTRASNAFAQKQASMRPVARAAPVSPLVTYALSSFALTDSHGRRVTFASCGGKRVGDLMWLCFRGTLTGGGAGIRVASQVLFDTFKDQINIVQASYGGHTTNLLFTPGEGAKSLP